MFTKLLSIMEQAKLKGFTIKISAAENKMLRVILMSDLDEISNFKLFNEPSKEGEGILDNLVNLRSKLTAPVVITCLPDDVEKELLEWLSINEASFTEAIVTAQTSDFGVLNKAVKETQTLNTTKAATKKTKSSSQGEAQAESTSDNPSPKSIDESADQVTPEPMAFEFDSL